MTDMENRLLLALDQAIAQRGKNKGMLKAKCPPMGTDGAVMWQALMLHANPYKVSIHQMMFASHGDSDFHEACMAFAEELASVLPLLDRDRFALERMGAW